MRAHCIFAEIFPFFIYLYFFGFCCWSKKKKFFHFKNENFFNMKCFFVHFIYPTLVMWTQQKNNQFNSLVWIWKMCGFWFGVDENIRCRLIEIIEFVRCFCVSCHIEVAVLENQILTCQFFFCKRKLLLCAIKHK